MRSNDNQIRVSERASPRLSWISIIVQVIIIIIIIIIVLRLLFIYLYFCWGQFCEVVGALVLTLHRRVFHRFNNRQFQIFSCTFRIREPPVLIVGPQSKWKRIRFQFILKKTLKELLGTREPEKNRWVSGRLFGLLKILRTVVNHRNRAFVDETLSKLH